MIHAAQLNYDRHLGGPDITSVEQSALNQTLSRLNPVRGSIELLFSDDRKALGPDSYCAWPPRVCYLVFAIPLHASRGAMTAAPPLLKQRRWAFTKYPRPTEPGGWTGRRFHIGSNKEVFDAEVYEIYQALSTMDQRQETG